VILTRTTILPGTGRGTMRSMVEGYVQSNAAYDLLCPSTTLRVVPLPLRGRIA
jgi:hypothetical protein